MKEGNLIHDIPSLNPPLSPPPPPHEEGKVRTSSGMGANRRPHCHSIPFLNKNPKQTLFKLLFHSSLLRPLPCFQT